MGDQRAARVDETLKTLFESFIPPPNHDQDWDDEQIDDTIEYARRTVHEGAGELPSDINQAQDLIKRKLLRENASPEKAARFSNLYSRLLSTPVLNQKWSILYLLYKMSEDDVAPSPIRQPLAESSQLENTRHKEALEKKRLSKGVRSPEYQDEEPIFREQRRTFEPVQRPRGPSQVAVEAAEAERPRSSGVNGTVPSHAIDITSCPSEADLLRDLPFNLQGLSSEHFKFTSSTTVQLPNNLPIPALSLLNTLAEPCLLYKILSTFSEGNDGGLVTQSFRAAISNELRSYLGLVATLEGEIRRALTATKDDEGQDIRKAGVTLKRCVIWTRDATMGLRLMSVMVDKSANKKGGQLISLIHGFSSSHGDPFVGAFAERLLTHVTRPFYDMLHRWIYDGELIDPHQDFFVTEPDPNTRPEIDPRRVSTSVWEDKYKLDDSMVPSIMSADFAKKVFLIGKSLNFIRHSCGDSDWVIQYSRSHSKSLDYENSYNLSTSIDSAYETTMSRLTYLMSNKFHLFTHLTAIKKYLLLSQGDFIALLMESLAPNLDRPSNSQYRHTLTSQLEHAIRHSNAQYDDPEVLRRLDARMLELSTGEIGWDCFTLEYKISPPCDVVITQWASTQYLKVFNLLWRIKRVEFSMNTTWRRCMTGSRGVLAAVEDNLGADWKRARCVMAEMIHFVNQLQYYILFEVIESSWEQLQTAMHTPNSTLDDLIEAHTKYINNITRKGLLGSSRHASTGHQEDSFLAQIHYIRKCMLSYREAVEGLYSFSVAEFSRRQQFSAKIDRRTAQGKWGVTEKDFLSRPASASADSNASSHSQHNSPFPHTGTTSALPGGAGAGDDAHLLASLRTRMLHLSAEFRSRVTVLLYDLAHQPDVDMRFLGVVMNFNEVYRPVNVRRQMARREKERERTVGRDGGAKGKSRDFSGSTVAGGVAVES